MLLIAKSIHQLNFSELMCVYEEEIIQNAKKQYPNLSENEAMNCVEQELYHYLNSVFFCQDHAFCAIWEENGKYQSALRLEPYQDGYLLSALHTKSESRCMGFATYLISGVCSMLDDAGDVTVYSHVSKENLPSLIVHENCGFSILNDHAIFIDGSVSYNSYTLAFTHKNPQSI